MWNRILAPVLAGALLPAALSACGGNTREGTASGSAGPRDGSPTEPDGSAASGSGGAPASDGGATIRDVPDASIDSAIARPAEDGGDAPDVSKVPADGGATEPDAPPPRDLTGFYDIEFDPVAGPADPDCAPLWPAMRTRLQIGPQACRPRHDSCAGAALEEPSIHTRHYEAASAEHDAATTVFTDFEPRRGHGGVTETVESLRLDTNAGGFTGTGTATIRRRCDETDDLVYEVAVRIGPDETPPVFFPDPPPFFAPYAVSWGEFRIEATEPVSLEPYWNDFGAVFGLVSADDPDDRPAVSSIPSLWVALSVDAPAAVASTSQRLFAKVTLTDSAGHAATVDPTPVAFATDAPIDGVLDFDSFAPTSVPLGIHGNATYYPPGSENAPCESGGCLVLGPLEPCHQHDGPTFFSMRYLTDEHVNLKVRLAVESSSTLQNGIAVYVDAAQYIQLGPLGGRPLLDHPDPSTGLQFTTGFVDSEFPAQTQSARGGAFALACNELPDHELVRLILERIEVIEDEDGRPGPP